MTAPAQTQPLDAFNSPPEQLLDLVGVAHGPAENAILAQACNAARHWQQQRHAALSASTTARADYHADLARQHEAALRAYIYAILVYREVPDGA
jgi:hypothetical protein